MLSAEENALMNVIRRELGEREIGIEVLTNLNADTIAEFRSALYAELEQPQENVVLDLLRVRSINSAALGAILLFQKKALERGKHIRIARCSEELRATLHAIRMDEILDMPQENPPAAPR
jgi:anti-anti-sigma factor